MFFHCFFPTWRMWHEGQHQSKITATVCQIVKKKKKDLPTCSSHRASFTHREFASQRRHSEQLSPLVVPAYVLNFFFVLVCKMKPDSRSGCYSMFSVILQHHSSSGWGEVVGLDVAFSPSCSCFLIFTEMQEALFKKAFQFVQPTMFILAQS